MVVDFPDTLAKNVLLSAMRLISSPSSSPPFFRSDSSEVGGSVVCAESKLAAAAGVPCPAATLCPSTLTAGVVSPFPVVVATADGFVGVDSGVPSPSLLTKRLGAATTVLGSARSKALKRT